MKRASTSSVPMFFSSSSSSSSSGLVERTWTIHAVSPLSDYSLRPTDVGPMIDNDLCFGGDYCHLRWFTLDAVEQEVVDKSSSSGTYDDDGDDDNESTTNLGPAGRKRSSSDDDTHHRRRSTTNSSCQYRVLRTDHEILFGPYTNLHLFIDLYSHDERLLGSIGFCFVELSRGRIGSLGNFALVRASGASSGSSSLLTQPHQSPPAVEALWQWMESKTGCCVSRSPIRPTSDVIAATAALWTVQTSLTATTNRTTTDPSPKLRRTNHRTSTINKVEGSASVPAAGTRPLILTWTPPPDCQGRGIDTISTIVAPAHLTRLCHDLQFLENWKSELSLDVGNAASSFPFQKSQGSHNQRSDETSELPLRLLETIMNFVSNELGMSLRRYALSHATCTVGCLGSDGRCKPLSEPQLLEFLTRIRTVVHKLHDFEPDTTFFLPPDPVTVATAGRKSCSP